MTEKLSILGILDYNLLNLNPEIGDANLVYLLIVRYTKMSLNKQIILQFEPTIPLP